MKLHFYKILLVATISLICRCAFGQTTSTKIYLDFGLEAPSWSTVKPNYWAKDRFYNVIPKEKAASADGGAAGSSFPIKNSKGVSSGITLTIKELFDSGDRSGTFSPATPIAEFNVPDVSSDYLQITDAHPTASFTLSGLIAGKAYKFTIFGSRDGVPDERSATYTLIGDNSESVTLDASNNTSNIVSTGYILPKADGTIEFSMKKGASNSNFEGCAYINGMEIEIATAPDPKPNK